MNFNFSHRTVLIAFAAAMLVATPLVQADTVSVSFTVNSATLTPGSGYGVDADERSGTLLGVSFADSFLSPETFTLSSLGASHSFNISTVSFTEPDAHSGITANETDHLGVTASFTLAAPWSITQNLTASGVATAGAASDSSVDYTLSWTPLPFSLEGVDFLIELLDLSFAGTGIQTQTARITLLAAPEQQDVVQGLFAEIPATSIPEPGSLALVGLALTGLMALRRKVGRHLVGTTLCGGCPASERLR